MTHWLFLAHWTFKFNTGGGKLNNHVLASDNNRSQVPFIITRKSFQADEMNINIIIEYQSWRISTKKRPRKKQRQIWSKCLTCSELQPLHRSSHWNMCSGDVCPTHLWCGRRRWHQQWGTWAHPKEPPHIFPGINRADFHSPKKFSKDQVLTHKKQDIRTMLQWS